MALLSEEIERAALEEVYQAAGPELCNKLGIDGSVIGSAFVLRASALPSSAVVINRAIGVGLAAPETEATVKQIVDAFQSAGIERYFVQVHPDAEPSSIADWLGSLGLERARGWQKFSRGREVVPEPKSDLTIRKIGASDAAASARILSDAFDLGDVSRPWLEMIPTCAHWHVFMSFDGDQPAGTGALYIDGDVAWTDFGATAPQFRQRGSQSSLLRYRVQYALDHGCKQVFTCTGEEVPGDPQHSYSNILKTGFREEYVRHNFAPPRLT